MSTQTTCLLRQYAEGDPEALATSGPIEWQKTVTWNGNGVQEGELDSGSGTTLRIPIIDSDNRQCLAIQAAGMSVKRGLDPDFGWAGGDPVSTIDLDDYVVPASTTTVASIKIVNLWVLTDRVAYGTMTVANPTTGRWYYVEGEPESTFRTWDPTA